jgi:hypothetical protein
MIVLLRGEDGTAGIRPAAAFQDGKTHLRRVYRAAVRKTMVTNTLVAQAMHICCIVNPCLPAE